MVVVTTPSTTNAATTHQALVALTTMRLPVMELLLCPETQADILHKYAAISGRTKFPQVFFEDAIDGANCEFVALDEVQVCDCDLGFHPCPLKLVC